MDRYEAHLLEYERAVAEDPEATLAAAAYSSKAHLSRRMLIDQLEVENVDLRDYVDQLSLPALWDVARYNPATKALNLSGWNGVSEVGIRALSLCMGDSLEVISLAGSPLTDSMIGVLVARLFSAQAINLSGCKYVSDVGLRELALGTRKTITSLNLARCGKVTEDGLAWLAGTAGAPPRPCSLLSSLNLQACPRVRDEGLVALGTGCTALQFVNLRECAMVTDAGVAGLAKGCRSLSVLNLYGCVAVGNGGLRAVGACCPLLKSLNVSRCVEVGDAGVRAVGEGCTGLQCLNLAGCSRVSERGVCFVAFHCKSLQYLNVSGCEEVTQRGLRELLHGLPYVELAHSYFGFKPRPDAVHDKLRAQQKTIEDAAAMRIQCAYRGAMVRRELRRLRRAARERAAATLVQRRYKGMKARLLVKRMLRDRLRTACATTIQSFVRQVEGKMELMRRRQRQQEFLEQVRYVVLVQANFRGRRQRTAQDTIEIRQAIAEMYEERWAQCEEAVAARVQSLIRGRAARNRLHAYKEEVQHRRRDEQLGATRVQAAYRGHQGRLCALEARRQREIWYFSVLEATLLVQTYMRRGLAYRLARRLRAERLAAYRRCTEAAKRIQRVYNGYLGRLLFFARLRERVVEIRAVTHLQKMYRSSKVMGWKELKFNVMRKAAEAKDAEVRKEVMERAVMALELGCRHRLARDMDTAWCDKLASLQSQLDE